ncbi:DUF6415 family natural product biosynthesis protein [Streptomyces kronopolitis]|uniref:DUF6415 family natural product biosynthesis protein n=1 Tax=Streptomyces kronopolitis TaxID=1612435 RepID=UPI0020BFE9B8|nr:DUF6415 family natural product biosynthesis protein [Streptomyces kronopolitis]MCL6299347.1 DUF6415 family natural product biosynthesis protein [Streptomyces kronopolitis]
MVELSTRHPGGAWRHQAPDRESIAEAAPDDGTAILLLEALRRWQVEESDEPVHITRDAVRRTIDHVLSVHYDNVDDADAADTVATLKGFLAALADAAEAHLDTGRVVVREVVARARRLSGQEPQPSRAAARQAAGSLRDALALLEGQGWERPREFGRR